MNEVQARFKMNSTVTGPENVDKNTTTKRTNTKDSFL